MTILTGRGGVADRLATVDPGTKTWFRPLLVATLVTSAVGNLAGLVFAEQIYGQETDALADASLAQDVGALTVGAATLLMMALGRRHAGRDLIGFGVAGFLAYNAVIYCFDITFGPLFLVWTLVLGLSVFTMASGFRLMVTDRLAVEVRRNVFASVLLLAIAVLFALLWLSEISADLLAGNESTSAAAWHVPTNPVHVLDLSLALPVAFLTGLAALRRRPDGILATPAVLTLFMVMSLPIVLTPVASAFRSHPTEWLPVAPVSTIAVLCAIALWQSLRTPRADRGAPRGNAGAAGSAAYERHSEGTVTISARASDVFVFVDDHKRLTSHMNKTSWMTGGGRMSVMIDDRRFQALGSQVTMSGRAFGFRIFLDEIVTDHSPPYRKTWETVGNPRLVVIGRYGMGFDIRTSGAGCELRVWIDYDLPPQRWWGRLFGSAYAKWCVSQMINDTRAHFEKALTRHEAIATAVRK
jgi:hypothetical protein